MVVVLTLEDIEREYLLVRAKLSLVQREPSLTTQLASECLTCTLYVRDVSTLRGGGWYQRRYDTRASIRLIASAITLSVGG